MSFQARKKTPCSARVPGCRSIEAIPNQAWNNIIDLPWGRSKIYQAFLSKHNISLDSIKMHSTVTFFTTLEQNRLGILHPNVVKTNLELMVTIYANEKTKKRCTAESHSVLVDASILYGS